MNSVTWNMLDNNQEQLNLKRADRIRSAEQALALLAKNKDKVVGNAEDYADAIPVEYVGPKLTWPLTLQSVLAMMEDFKNGKILHHAYVTEVLHEVRKTMGALSTLQEIKIEDGSKLTIVGDIHGQLQDLYSIFTINGIPSMSNKYLFNGDFVDRGDYGIEVVVTMFCFKLLYPEGVYMNRGNHESRNQNSWMGFEEELWSKYDGSDVKDPSRANRLFNLFQLCFDSLPLCALVQEKIFVVHGGLTSKESVTLAHLNSISRKREPPLHQTGYEDRIFEDMLWSDPRNIQGKQPSERGAGIEFGQDVTNNFCAVNRVALIVRSHECVPEGYEVLHGGRLITLFSASRYCGTQTNKGAFLSLGNDLQPEIQQFYAHPMNETDFGIPENKMQEVLVEDNLRMIAERICDHKSSLFWYYTQHDQEHQGSIPRLVWAEGLRSVMQLDIPFLNYQKQLATTQSDNTINYAKFLARYRIENDMVDNSGWQESVIANICKKLYKAMGGGNTEQAFAMFDSDANGYIDYEEFMAALKKWDTGLSEQQVYELMRSADSNEDSRIDFKEFSARFEVIFTDVRSNRMGSIDHGSVHAQDAEPMDVDAMPPPAPTRSRRSSSLSEKLVRRYSDHDKSLNPVPAQSIGNSTMELLQRIGQIMFTQQVSLSALFTEFDTNGDGVLQDNEFYAALRKLGMDMTSDEQASVMAAVDIDQGNTIDYKEFVAAFRVQDSAEAKQLALGNLTWQQSVLQQMANVFYQHRIHLRSAFRMFDKDHSGVITREEFRAGIQTFNALLNSPLTNEQIEELLMHLDKNHDGVVCYTEFIDGFHVVDVRSPNESSAT